MKKLLLTATISGIAAMAIMAKATKNDPVVMTIDNRDVKLSEFEYLYNKNNNQQLTPLTFDEYVDLFVNYKLKVADALNAKLDTTTEFKTEFQKFRAELAQPYLRDEEVAEALVQEVYSHTDEDVYVSHIMMAPMAVNVVHRLDSIRTEIINGNTTFEEVAREISVDRASSKNGGRMGWVTGKGMYPWPFEKAAYDTPVGEISGVINSGVGYHLVRPEKRRPAQGEVLVSHILLLTRDLDEAAQAAQKAKIDSLYEVVTVGHGDFEELAKQYSDDPGSAKDGGRLPWFGPGRMVAEFDSVSFALPIGAISEPFKTSYGYHIVHKIDQRKALPLEDMRAEIEKSIESDSRAQQPVKAKIEKAAAETNSSISQGYKDEVDRLLAANNYSCDSTFVMQIKASQVPAFTANGKTVTLGEAMEKATIRPTTTPDNLKYLVDRTVESAFDAAMTEYQIDQLDLNEPAYSNLVNEYRDGILLFDISNQKVWDRATKDKEGLANYFNAHKEKYRTWEAPRFKAYVLFANNDSTLTEIMDYAQANYGNQTIAEINQEKFTDDIKKKFGKNVRVERIIAAKGDNPITDYLGFGAVKPEAKGQNWTSYQAFAGELIDQPEEVSDIKGAVISDYQSELEQLWIEDLHKKYNVKINKKELKKANK